MALISTGFATDDSDRPSLVGLESMRNVRTRQETRTLIGLGGKEAKTDRTFLGKSIKEYGAGGFIQGHGSFGGYAFGGVAGVGASGRLSTKGANNAQTIRVEWTFNQQWAATAMRDENGIVSLNLVTAVQSSIVDVVAVVLMYGEGTYIGHLRSGAVVVPGDGVHGKQGSGDRLLDQFVFFLFSIFGGLVRLLTASLSKESG
jgi:hypothetical protein